MWLRGCFRCQVQALLSLNRRVHPWKYAIPKGEFIFQPLIFKDETVQGRYSSTILRFKQIWGSVRWSQPLNGTEPPNHPKFWAMFVPLNHPLPLSLPLSFFAEVCHIFYYILIPYTRMLLHIRISSMYLLLSFLPSQTGHNFGLTFPNPAPSFQAFPSRASCCLCSSWEPEVSQKTS